MSRGNPNWQAGGSGAGRGRGRRPVGESLAERVRAAVDLDELIAFHASVMMSTTTPWRERLQAAQWLSDRGWGRPISTVDLTLNAGADYRLPVDWHLLSTEQKSAWLDASDQLALDEPDVLDESHEDGE